MLLFHSFDLLEKVVDGSLGVDSQMDGQGQEYVVLSVMFLKEYEHRAIEGSYIFIAALVCTLSFVMENADWQVIVFLAGKLESIG